MIGSETGVTSLLELRVESGRDVAGMGKQHKGRACAVNSAGVGRVFAGSVTQHMRVGASFFICWFTDRICVQLVWIGRVARANSKQAAALHIIAGGLQVRRQLILQSNRHILRLSCLALSSAIMPRLSKTVPQQTWVLLLPVGETERAVAQLGCEHGLRQHVPSRVQSDQIAGVQKSLQIRLSSQIRAYLYTYRRCCPVRITRRCWWVATLDQDGVASRQKNYEACVSLKNVANHAGKCGMQLELRRLIMGRWQ